MTVHDALITGIERLQSAKDHRDSAALDAEILLGRALSVPREELYTHPERRLTSNERRRFDALRERRARHEPTAYILGEKEFYGLKFAVTPDVLIPRPETEGLVEAVIRHCERSEAIQSNRGLLRRNTPRNDPMIIDVGTGSGAIAVALATHLPTSVRIVATDVSGQALAVARANARRHRVAKRIRFKRCDLLPPPFHPSRQRREIKNLFPSLEGRGWGRVTFVANLPYLPTALWRKTTPEIKKYEPRLALVGGKDGLNVYRRLLVRIPHLHLPLPTEGGGKRNRFLPSAYRGEYEGGSWTLIAEMLPTQMRRFSSEVYKRFPRARIQRVAPMIIQVSPALN